MRSRWPASLSLCVCASIWGKCGPASRQQTIYIEKTQTRNLHAIWPIELAETIGSQQNMRRLEEWSRPRRANRRILKPAHERMSGRRVRARKAILIAIHKTHAHTNSRLESLHLAALARNWQPVEARASGAIMSLEESRAERQTHSFIRRPNGLFAAPGRNQSSLIGLGVRPRGCGSAAKLGQFARDIRSLAACSRGSEPNLAEQRAQLGARGGRRRQ